MFYLSPLGYDTFNHLWNYFDVRTGSCSVYRFAQTQSKAWKKRKHVSMENTSWELYVSAHFKQFIFVWNYKEVLKRNRTTFGLTVSFMAGASPLRGLEQYLRIHCVKVQKVTTTRKFCMTIFLKHIFFRFCSCTFVSTHKVIVSHHVWMTPTNNWTAAALGVHR